MKSMLLCSSSDGDVEYAVPRGMDPDMEEDYEKFVAENEAQWLSKHTSTS